MSAATFPVRSVRAAVTAFGVDPISGRSDRRLVTAVRGTPDRLVSGEVARPRFSEDNKTVLFLSPRPTTADKTAYDLYELPVGSTTPKVVLSDVDWFDLVAD